MSSPNNNDVEYFDIISNNIVKIWFSMLAEKEPLVLINLISDKKLIHIANDWVTNQNTSLIYEEFCSKIDDLSKQINESGYKTEEKLFSIGGRKKGKWRQYVIDNYK